MLAMAAPGDVVNPEESAPSEANRAPPPPEMSSVVMVANERPLSSTPEMTHAPPPADWQLAMTSWESSSEVSSMRATQALTQMRTAWPLELVLMATPAGQRASTTVPGRLTISTTGQMP